MRRASTILSVIVCGVVFVFPSGRGVHAQTAPQFTEAAPGQTAPADAVPEMDFQEADAFIWSVYAELEYLRYDAAAQTYLWLLEQLDRPLSAEEQIILRKHLRPLAMIMPAPERAAVNLDEALTEGDLTRLSPGVGARMAQWWRRLDPLPATAENERLQEHLTRVAFAAHKYQRDDDERGFDDRGEIYVRLGKPSRSKTITIRSGALLVHPFTSKIPDNEFWVYKQVSYDAHYVFHRKSKKEAYTIGYSTDLIPPTLRNGKRKTPLLLQLMEEIYAQLALEHGSFGVHYDAVVDYQTLPPRNANPYLFAQRTIQHAFTDDQRHEWTRETMVPASYYNALHEAEALTVPVRWARFLDADESTRTEFYWGLEARALLPSRRLVRQLMRQGHEPSDKYLISVSVAQRTADYQNRHINKKHYLIPTTVEGTLPTKTLIARGDTATYHLAMQWDQQWIRADKENPEALMPGATLKIGTFRLDTLQALDSQGLRLEMSDLKPLLLAPESTFETATPYPYEQLAPETPLALYFELYHLTFGSDDQTHYAIEYTMTQKEKRGLLQRQELRDGEGVGASSRYTGASRIAKEYIMIDLRTWQGNGAMDITLRATDETTGAQIERTIPFLFER